MNIYQKLIEVRKVVPYLQKENKGTQYQYVSSSQVLAAVREKMDELNLLLIPKVLGHTLRESAIEYYDSEGRPNKRTITYFTELDIEYTWVNADNPQETIVSPWYGQGMDISGEKGVGKALTYAEKYFLLKFFNIATDKDDPDSFQDSQHNDHKSEPVGPTIEVLKAKWKTLGWPDDKFDEWYKEQVGKKVNHKSMDNYLTKKLKEKNDAK